MDIDIDIDIDMDELNANIPLHELDQEAKEALFLSSAKEGEIDTLQALLMLGVNVEARDEYHEDETALIWAAYKGHTAIVELLIQQGANLEAMDTAGDTALILAAYKDHVGIVHLLNQHGANIEHRGLYHDTALIVAASGGYTPIVDFLSQQGAELEVVDKYRKTALIWAAQHNHINTVRFLLKAGVNTETVSPDGSTALILAACRGHTEIVDILIQKGANIRATTLKRHTALRKAVAMNHHETAFRLLSAMKIQHINVGRELLKFDLKPTIDAFEKNILENKKMIRASVIGTFSQAKNQVGLFMLPLELKIKILANCFPIWYRHRIEQDMQSMLPNLDEIVEKIAAIKIANPIVINRPAIPPVIFSKQLTRQAKRIGREETETEKEKETVSVQKPSFKKLKWG